MNIKLLKLRLKNFKGIKTFEFTSTGQSIEIHGDNASGKTSVFDSFLWLMFDKDSEGKKTFEIKTLTIDNKPIHQLEHEVEALLEIDGNEVTFRKMYYENWVKRRGELTTSLQGHSTDYWIDGVPQKKGEYESYIKNLIDEETFKLLTDVRYFTEKIEWKARRSLIERIAENHMKEIPVPPEIAAIIGNKSLDDFKKMKAEQKKELKKAIDQIPIRIDELMGNLPVITGIDFEEIQMQITILEKVIKNFENSGKQIMDHNNKLYQLKSDINRKRVYIADLEEQIKKDANKDYENYLADKANFERRKTYLDSLLETLKSQLTMKSSQLEAKNKEIQLLREQWNDINKSTMPVVTGLSCPTCGKEFDPEKVTDLVYQAGVEFETDKKKKLDNITLQGKSLAGELATLKEQFTGIETEIETAENDLRIVALNIKELKEVRPSGIEFSENQTWVTAKAEMEAIQHDIDTFKPMDDTKVEEDKRSAKADIQAHMTTIAGRTQYELGMERKTKLMAEEVELAAKLVEIDKIEFAIQKYTMDKINNLESAINGMFKNIKFKMFQDQLNGGITEICEILINGVPYSSANYAGRINAGLEIINVLSKEYGILAPVFVDNSESVTRLMELDQQMIKLVVNKQFKNLTIKQEVAVNE